MKDPIPGHRYNAELDMYDFEFDEAIHKMMRYGSRVHVPVISRNLYAWAVRNGHINPENPQHPV